MLRRFIKRCVTEAIEEHIVAHRQLSTSEQVITIKAEGVDEIEARLDRLNAKFERLGEAASKAGVRIAGAVEE